jgi:hypothetical protein
MDEIKLLEQQISGEYTDDIPNNEHEELKLPESSGRELILSNQHRGVIQHNEEEDLQPLQLDERELILQLDERELIKNAFRNSPRLFSLVHSYTEAVDTIIKKTEEAKYIANEIRDIIRDIYYQLFPNKETYVGVVTIVRDIFYEEFLGWKLLPDGKHDPGIWQTYPATGERVGPTKLQPEFEKVGKTISGLVTSVQKTLNKKSSKSIVSNNAEVCSLCLQSILQFVVYFR